jgi:hypothetical protein
MNNIEEAISELRVALIQALDSDDQIIVGHMRKAYELLTEDDQFSYLKAEVVSWRSRAEGLEQSLVEAGEHIRRLDTWVSDLQSGLYVNCVYCGHRYGPDPGTPVAMADVLKQHIAECPAHPMSGLIAALRQAEGELENFNPAVALVCAEALQKAQGKKGFGEATAGGVPEAAAKKPGEPV